MLQQSRRLMKPFGWGAEGVHFEGMGQPSVRTYLADKFKVEVKQAQPQTFPPLTAVALEPTRLPSGLLAELRRLVGEAGVSVAHDERVRFSGGRSYRDLIALRSLALPEAPDVVLRPSNLSQLSALIEFAGRYRMALVPFAGGTSVVGGLDATRGDLPYSAAVDMTAFDEVTAFDEESRLISVGAGIYGPALEAYLNQRGYTLGHFPQSFEYTTLGGWVSARSSGQNSLLYGSIDKLVFSLTMLTPRGLVTTAAAPNLACGPDIKQVLIGSEGVFGMVVACTLKVRPLPEEKLYFAYAFRSFGEAAAAARVMVQSELRAAMVRVADEAETESMLALGSSGQEAGLAKKLIRKFGVWQMRRRGFPMPRIAMMTVGLEGSRDHNRYQQGLLTKLLAGHHYQDLGRAPGEKWLRERFRLPYARDAFMDQSLLVDTFETATTWQNRDKLYRCVQEAMAEVCGKELQVPHVLFCHLSHIYESGTSLYFTIICRQLSDPLAQWTRIKTAASAAIIKAGGVISHHHGVGRDHRDFLAWSEPEREVWAAVKGVFDPQAIMNPGKLI